MHTAAVEDRSFEEWLGEELDLLGDVEQLPPSDVDMDEWVERRLARIRELKEELARNDQAAQRRIAMVEQWQAEQNAPLQKKIEWIEQTLLQIVPAFPFPKGKKSRRLPSGTIGVRRVTKPEKVEVIDETLVIQFAEQTDGLREQIKKSIGLTPLKDYYKSTGEIPPGCDVVEATSEDRPYIDTEAE